MTTDYLIIELDGERYAVPVSEVLKLLQFDTDALHTPFGGDDPMVGFISHHDRVIPVVDLRRSLGMVSMEQETAEVVETLEQRKADHVHWLNELEASVRENRDFQLTTDPHACAFGKWYDALRANQAQVETFTNGNGPLEEILRAFDEPHRKIHRIAGQVRALYESGQHDEAIALIEQTRQGDLRTMVKLFDRACAMFKALRRTLLVVLDHGDERLAVVIDQVLGLRPLPRECEQEMQVTSPLIRAMSLPNPNEHPIAILDVEALYASARGVADAA